MTLSTDISTASVNDQQAWDAYVMGHPNGLAYQLAGFSLAIEQAYGFKTTLLWARQGNRVKGVLPLIRVRLPGSCGSLVSLPYCDAGGVLADSSHIEAGLLAHALSHADASGIGSLALRSSRPFAGLDPAKTLYPAKARMVLDLPHQPDMVLARLKAKVRSQVLKPMRDGLTFKIGGRELVRPFFNIYAQNMRDLGSPAHGITLMHQVMRHLGNRAHIGMVSLPDQTPAAGGMLLCHKRTVSVPWASSLRRYNSMNPNMLLYWKFLAFAAARGFKQFDFGRSTPGQGTFRFKRQWGATPEFLHWTRFVVSRNLKLVGNRASGSDANGVRQYLAQGIMAMPTGLSTALGAVTRRFITL